MPKPCRSLPRRGCAAHRRRRTKDGRPTRRCGACGCGGSLLGGDEVPAGGLALGGVADHRDFLRDVEGQEVVLAGTPAGFTEI